MANLSCMGVGCLRTFNDSRALKTHTRSCYAYKREAKRRLRPVSPTLALQDALDIPNHESGMDVDLAEPSSTSSIGDVEMNESVPREPTPVQEYRPSGLPKRRIRLPARFRDIPPPPPPAIPNLPMEVIEDVLDLPTNDIPPTPDFESEANSYSVYRIYHGQHPSYTPDELDSASDSHNFTPTGPKISIAPHQNPFPNTSILRLMNWFHNNATSKTLNDLDTLVHEVILAPDFDINHFINFRGSQESERLDKFCDKPESPFSGNSSWIETSLNISVPCEKIPHDSESNTPVFKVEGLFYRHPLEVIKAAYRETTAQQFHITPYKEYWRPSPNSPPERIYSELYNSDVYIQEHERIKAQPRMPGPQLETVVAAIMLSSDSTQLTSFGTASLWPIYLYLGNLSKYTRLKPNSFAAHHLAYIPKLGDTIQDFYRATYNKAASSEMLTHLRRELMQAIWLLLLDDEFMEAYVDGIVLEFNDGIIRRLYPRFFTYSADYPEKVLLACIKYLGKFPCPRCLIPSHQISELGTKNDLKRRKKLARVDNKQRRDKVEVARKWIYKKGVNVKSKSIKDLLGPTGWTPTRNAFSEKLSPLGFDFHSMFVPDLLHEFELGVWKATFSHLMRILYAEGGDAITSLNSRYCQVPSFGRDTIRKFNNNASGMKKLAARDYEDLLQCAIPVFEGLLLEPHNKIIHGLLFELATWHALAKLRLHTESTITALETSTMRLGTELRKFASTTCEAYETRELPSEESARGRRKAALSAKKSGLQKRTSTKKTSSGPRKRMFNLSSYKPHSLPDYVTSIRMYGTTDNYTTQAGELEHRRVKRQYPRAQKGKFTAGIAKQTRRERFFHNVMKRHSHLKVSRKRKHGNPSDNFPTISSTVCGNPSIPFSSSEPLPAAPSNQHYQMSTEIRHKVLLTVWLGDNKGDPALKNFLPCLQDHLLGRLLGRDFTGDEEAFTATERSKISFLNGQLYRHKVLHVNYTSYDLRHCQDSLNPRTHPNIMVLSHEDDDTHPYWYAKIIGIFHAIIQHPSKPDPVSMDFLWVRWYGRNIAHQSGWRSKHLPCIGFVDSDDDLPFGFLDPLHVVRGCHLIPAFHYGRTDDLLPPSIACLEIENDEDWLYYYVNIFVDRDMMMRYRGGGVGHKSTRDETNKFLVDRDDLDIITAADQCKKIEQEDDEVVTMDGDSGGENVCEGDEEKELDQNEDNNESEDDDDGDEAIFEEEFDYGLPGGGGSDNEDNEEVDAEVDEDVLGPEDGEEEDDDDFGYADL